MTTWAITYKHDGVTRWEIIEAAHTFDAKILFLDTHSGDNVEILDVDEYVVEVFFHSPKELRKKFSVFC